MTNLKNVAAWIIEKNFLPMKCFKGIAKTKETTEILTLFVIL